MRGLRTDDLGGVVNQRRDTIGQYQADFARVCRCGHTLGEHTAVRDIKAKSQPCLAEGTTGVIGGAGCPCEFFIAQRKAH